jgi:hypothetical protein
MSSYGKKSAISRRICAMSELTSEPLTTPRTAAPPSTNSVVLVPVPVELLGAVYDLLAQSMRVPQQPPNGSNPEQLCPRCHCEAFARDGVNYQCSECGLAFRDSDPRVIVDRDNGSWTPAMVAALRQEIGSDRTLVRIIDLIAESAPATVSSENLARATGSTAPQLRAELAALSKAATRLFGKKMWPISAKAGWGNGERMGYRMSPTIASWWREPA